MDQEMLRHIGDGLNARLNELLPAMQKLHPRLQEHGNQHEPMDEADLASKRCEQQLMIQIQHRTRQLVREIEEALMRIKRGKFGVCEECGRDIELRRLRVQPMTTLCIQCQKDIEAMKRLKVA